MDPLVAYALGLITTSVLCGAVLGLMAYMDHRRGQTRLVERRGAAPSTETPPLDPGRIPVTGEPLAQHEDFIRPRGVTPTKREAA